MDDSEKNKRRDEARTAFYNAFSQAANRPKEALTMLQEVCDREAVVRTLNPEEYFAALNNLGCLQVELNGWKAGRFALLKSIEVAREEIGNKSLEYAVGLSIMARYKLRGGASLKIKEHQLQSIEILRNTDTQQWRVAYARTMLELGVTCRQLDQLPEAEEWGEKAIQILEQYEDSETETLLVSLYSLGETYAKREKYELAESCYFRALALVDKCAENKIEHRAQILTGLAMSHQHRGQLGVADRYYSKAIQQYEQLDPKNPGFVRCLNAYADHLRGEGRIDAADKASARAADLQQQQ